MVMLTTSLILNTYLSLILRYKKNLSYDLPLNLKAQCHTSHTYRCHLPFFISYFFSFSSCYFYCAMIFKGMIMTMNVFETTYRYHLPVVISYFFSFSMALFYCAMIFKGMMLMLNVIFCYSLSVVVLCACVQAGSSGIALMAWTSRSGTRTSSLMRRTGKLLLASKPSTLPPTQ